MGHPGSSEGPGRMFGFQLAERCASGPGALRERVEAEGWNAFDVYAAGASGPRAMASMG